jgi:hypothetical protein
MVRFQKAVILALLPIFFLPNTAVSEKSVTWKEDVGGWDILVDTSQNNSCFMIAEYEGGTTLRVGFDASNDSVQFVIGNPDWRSIEHGKLYDLSVQFGNRTPWTAEGEGFWWGDSSPSLRMSVAFDKERQFDAGDFLSEYMKMTFVVVKYSGREIARLKLTGTNVAMNEVMACQTALMESDANKSDDPFSSSGTGSTKDPFQ